MTFDLAQHHRQRTRAAERRAEHLERQRAKLERLLVLALTVAVGTTGADRLELLGVLEDVDRVATESAVADERIAALLREPVA